MIKIKLRLLLLFCEVRELYYKLTSSGIGKSNFKVAEIHCIFSHNERIVWISDKQSLKLLIKSKKKLEIQDELTNAFTVMLFGYRFVVKQTWA